MSTALPLGSKALNRGGVSSEITIETKDAGEMGKMSVAYLGSSFLGHNFPDRGHPDTPPKLMPSKINKRMQRPEDLDFHQSHDLNSLKYFSLVALILQNAALILVMRYTRTQHGDMYLSSTAVVMSEMCKLLTCCVIIIYQEGGVGQFVKILKTDFIDCPLDCVKVSVPSIIYIIQNNLLYLAVSNLDAATFQELYPSHCGGKNLKNIITSSPNTQKYMCTKGIKTD
ncbi:hypothetical protein LOTGIDRAFT_158649 [Lottia gigantea]|uniref:Uncharacterized protein n=1 Tax=Lottia gigantea TaxID=225164 RepID=V4AWX4_LOTGI|nr:hypothetical protein LOTGIDRAFT_158649 [Lottia gigantea]ESO99555.1 hypothetical protein LOTGIDRAFT_158649 [Lottia gigantea]